MASWKEREASIRMKPTRVFLQATVIQSGGDIRDDVVTRIRQATIHAFENAVDVEGLTGTWTLELKAKTPKDFDGILFRRQMCLAEPEAAVTPLPDKAAKHD